MIRFGKQIKISWTSTFVEMIISLQQLLLLAYCFLSMMTFVGTFFPSSDDFYGAILSFQWCHLLNLSFSFSDVLYWPILSFQWWPLWIRSFLSLTVTSFIDSFFSFSDVLHLPVLSYQWWTSLTQAFLSMTTFIDPFFLSVMTFIDPFFPFSDDLHRCDRLLRWVKHSTAGSGELLHLRSCGHLRHICPPGVGCLVQVSGV